MKVQCSFSVNESEPKCAMLVLKMCIWDNSCLPFVQEANSVTWSGVELFKLVKSEGKCATFWLSRSFMPGSSLASSWTIVAKITNSLITRTIADFQ